MMNLLVVPVIFYISFRAYRFQGHLFFRFTQRKNKKYFITAWDFQGFREFFPVHSAEHTSAQFLSRRSQKNCLRGNSVITPERRGYFPIAQNKNISGGSFSFPWSGPVLQVTGPVKMGKNQGVFLRFTGKNVL